MKNKYIPLTIITLLSFFSVLTILTGIFFYSDQKDRVTEQEKNELQAISNLKINQLVDWRTERLGDANVIFEDPVIIRHFSLFTKPEFKESLRPHLINWMKIRIENYSYEGITLFNNNYEPILSTGDSANFTERYNKKTYSYLKKAVNNKQVVLSDLYETEENHTDMDLIVPLFDLTSMDSTYIGALLLRFRAEDFIFPLLNNQPIPGRSLETILFKKENESVLFLSNLKFDGNISQRTKRSLKDKKHPSVMTIYGERGFIEGEDYRNEPVLSVSNSIPGTDWFLLTKIDKAEVFEPLTVTAWLTFGSVLFLIIGVSAGAGFYYRNLETEHLKQKLKTETELREAENKYKDLFDNVPVGLYRTTPEGKFIDCNNEFTSIVGAESKQDILQKNVSEFYIDPDDRNKWISEIKSHGKLNTFEAKTRKINGDPIWIKHTAHAVSDNEGKIIELEGVIEDITDRKETDEKLKNINKLLEQKVKERTVELEYSNKELEAFSYSVSHDLRSPLRHLMGFSEMLKKNASDELNDKTKRHITIIHDSAKKMGQLIDDLLTFSRIGRTEIIKKKVPVKNIVEDALNDLKFDAAINNIDWKIKNSFPEIYCDPGLMKQVFLNLIGNAIKYSSKKEKPEITIGWEDNSIEKNYTFYIKDNGAGFDTQYVDKLFKVFQRLHRSDEFEGTGIGLANVKRIVNKHGGDVKAEGEVDKGASFYFTIPKLNGN